MADTDRQEETAELLVELYSEEIPWKLQEPMARNLERFLQEELAKALGLKKAEEVFGERRVYWTPRRIAVGIADVPVKSEAWEEERKGPKANSPQVAIDGFLRKNDLSLEDCQEKEGYLIFTLEHKAVSTSDLLGEVVVRVIKRMANELPVSMRFGEQSFRWVRPLRHIMVVFAGRGVTGALALGNGEKLAFTDETRGHPFAAPDSFSVTGTQDYEDKLRKNYVEPSYEKRLIIIEQELIGNKVIFDSNILIEENACLTEYPVILKGHLDEEFLDLPPFLINAVLSEHQKIIRNLDDDNSDGEFFVVTNTPHIKREEEKNNIIKGFERVVRARLSDAKFSLKRDKGKPITEHIKNSQHIIFHPSVGTFAEKNQRVKKLITFTASEIKKYNNDFNFLENKELVDIMKVDLATETVREFPSLQGEVGAYLLESEPLRPSREMLDEKIRVIKEQYEFNADTSSDIVSLTLLAARVDNIASLWYIEQIPSGSRDPFSLRRHATAIINTCDAYGWYLPLSNVFGEALSLLEQQGLEFVHRQRRGEIMDFILDRIRAQMKLNKEIRSDCVEAILHYSKSQAVIIKNIHANIIALTKEINNDNPLAEIFYRLNAILHASSYDLSHNSSPFSLPNSINPKLLFAEPEKDLHARTQSLPDSAWLNLTFREKLQWLGNLKDVIDPFFERVLVMDKDENIRLNRLSLLYSIYKRFLELADFTKIHHKDKQEKTKQEKAKQEKHSPKQP